MTQNLARPEEQQQGQGQQEDKNEYEALQSHGGRSHRRGKKYEG